MFSLYASAVSEALTSLKWRYGTQITLLTCDLHLRHLQVGITHETAGPGYFCMNGQIVLIIKVKSGSSNRPTSFQQCFSSSLTLYWIPNSPGPIRNYRMGGWM